MIVAGCKVGVPMRGGIPKQCAKAVAATLTVSAKQGQRHGLELCSEHFASITSLRQITEYTETATGQPTPLRVVLV